MAARLKIETFMHLCYHGQTLKCSRNPILKIGKEMFSKEKYFFQIIVNILRIATQKWWLRRKSAFPKIVIENNLIHSWLQQIFISQNLFPFIRSIWPWWQFVWGQWRISLINGFRFFCIHSFSKVSLKAKFR